MQTTTDRQAKAQGKSVQFGLDQISNPTPSAAKYVFRTILYLSAIWAVIMPTVTELHPDTIAAINKYMLLGNAVINVTIKFFGWDYQS
jgi:hypothetical protein